MALDDLKWKLGKFLHELLITLILKILKDLLEAASLWKLTADPRPSEQVDDRK